MIKENRKIRYRVPTKIIAQSDNIFNSESLLKEKDLQISISEPITATIEKGGYIILDFNEEMMGGIRILTSFSNSAQDQYLVRIRFGESVNETSAELGEKGASNDHSLRDFNTYLPAMSDQTFGDTGFRFVRIDNKGDLPIKIKSIYAKEWYLDLKIKENIKTSDKLITNIFDVCKRTIDVNIQNRIWDGIKRDRLVWIGDMEPEVHAILHLYGNIKQIEQSISSAELSYPLPCWLNGIPSYSIWYLLIIYDVYSYNKNNVFVKRHLNYMQGILHQLNEAIDEEGNLAFENVKECPSDFYFIDWPTLDEPLDDRVNTHINLLRYILPLIKEMYQSLGLDFSLIERMIISLSKKKMALPHKKQLLAFYQLVNKDKESYELLIKDGAKGMSTFMSYYILKAVSNYSFEIALKMMKEYYGAMLDKGATTFFEDFDLDWVNNSCRIDELVKGNQLDIHGDFGKFCYKGFRHSLCHGWSVGPISFLLENKDKLK